MGRSLSAYSKTHYRRRRTAHQTTASPCISSFRTIRDIATLTHCDPKEVAAIELALQFKGDLSALGSLDKIQLRQGVSVGPVWTVYEVARRRGIDTSLGHDFAGQLALWPVLARVLDQGSRLSAVRLAQVHAA